MSRSVALIGTGSNPDDPDASGYAMAYHHANAYESIDGCELVACADIVPENAAAFADRFDIPESQTFEAYEEMLAEVDVDVLSVCVPPAVHADVVTGAIHAGDPAAIHCEKPMDLTWGGAKRMAQTAWRHDVQLTFNHQRRFKPSWATARERIADGVIGDLERIETTPPNIYDWGTHALDFAADVAGDRPAEWVIGQIDYREEQVFFGAHNENQAYGLWEYDNGVTGVVSTSVGASLAPAFFRFYGTDGVLDLGPDDEDVDLRWRAHGDDDWTRHDADEGGWTDPIEDAIADCLDCLETGDEPALSARNALNSTEIIFGIYESARRRGRVEFPLQIEDNPLHEMVDSGALDPQPPEE